MLTAFVNAFGRVISELGIAMMLGGNIKGSTLTLTTAIALETARGEFALAVEPDLLLLDDPTTFLDSVTASFVENLLKNLNKSGYFNKPITVVFSTHNAQQAYSLADIIINIHSGKIEAVIESPSH